MKHLALNSKYPSRDLTQAPSEYKPGELSLQSDKPRKASIHHVQEELNVHKQLEGKPDIL